MCDQAVAPLILIGTNEGVGAIYGSIIASGIFVVLVSGVFSKIKTIPSYSNRNGYHRYWFDFDSCSNRENGWR